MNGLTRWCAVFAVLALAACGGPSLKQQAKDLDAGETGKVAAIHNGDLLSLEDGLKVRLSGIDAPKKDAPLGAEARSALEALAAGRPVQLFYGGARRLNSRVDANDAAEAPAAPTDGVALAQVYVQTESGRWIWLQQALLETGMARVHSWKDNQARLEPLLAAEAKARAAGLGLWAQPDYRVFSAEAAGDALVACAERNARSCFQIVEGRVRTTQDRNDRTYLNFGDDPMSDFTIAMDGETASAWPGGAAALAGRKVRVRGYLSDRGGPLIRVDHPGQIEDLGTG
jgi:micrococcal nuclease